MHNTQTLVFKNTGNGRTDLKISVKNVYNCCACFEPMRGICFKNLPKILDDKEQNKLSEYLDQNNVIDDIPVDLESEYNFFCEKCS